MSEDTTTEERPVCILDNGEYRDAVYNVPVTVGKSPNCFIDFKKEGQYLQNWEAKDLIIEDFSCVAITDSTIHNLNVRGLCVLKHCIVDRVRVAILGNVFIFEDNEIQELDISGTVRTISSSSKVDHINLRHGGRIKLRTKAYQLGTPPRPKNIRMDGDREWYCDIPVVTKHQDFYEAEYWAFG